MLGYAGTGVYRGPSRVWVSGLLREEEVLHHPKCPSPHIPNIRKRYKISVPCAERFRGLKAVEVGPCAW